MPNEVSPNEKKRREKKRDEERKIDIKVSSRRENEEKKQNAAESGNSL